MSLVVTSLKKLRQIHELTKQFQSFSYLLEDQKRVIEEQERLVGNGDDDFALVEEYEFAFFDEVRAPDEAVSLLYARYGRTRIEEIIKREKD